MTREQDSNRNRAATGVTGIDVILGGGLPRNRLYLIEGDPGAGKTTLSLQFLIEGLARGEPGLYVTLSETEEELRDVAASHGWSLDGLRVCDLAGSEESLKADAQYTLFHPSEIELGEVTRSVLDEVERVRPLRVVFDSLSEIRLLARDPLRYRRQILSLKQFFIGRQCTVLLLDDRTGGEADYQLESLVHGVLSLEQMSPAYGGQRRRLRVSKLRGVKFRDGYHDYTIETGGLSVHPRLVAAEHHRDFRREMVPSGIAGLDALTGGGLDRGTSTLLMGPAGSGKSTLAATYAFSAAERGECATIFAFDEGLGTLFARCAALGMDLQGHAAAGRMVARQIDSAELSPGAFAHLVVDAVEQHRARVVVIDSINGYQYAMPEERFLSSHLHELLAYLSQQGVLTLLCMAQHGLVGQNMTSPADISYIADAVLLLRYFEAAGEVRQAVSVMKKRGGWHERSMREFQIRPGGIHVGETLHEFRGVLTGVPAYEGGAVGTERPKDVPRAA
jgi:circadian clock protein KaiC